MNRRFIVSKIYLFKDGHGLEIHFQKTLINKIKRDQQKIINLYIPNIEDPENAVLPLNYFPSEYPYKDDNSISLQWVKQLNNSKQKFILHKYYNYFNPEILISAFNGVPIDTSSYAYTDEDQYEKYLDK